MYLHYTSIIAEVGVLGNKVGNKVDNEDIYSLDLDNIFYEFKKDVDKKVSYLFLEDLKSGDIVTLIVITDVGLYRYRLPFSIEVVETGYDKLLFKIPNN